MTIKPVVVATTQKRVPNDGDKKESHAHSHATHSVEPANSLSQHRNVVIDGHGQSPKRRNEVYDEITRHRRSPHKSTRTKRRDHHDVHHKRERNEREKHVNVITGAVSSKCSSPHVHGHAATAGIVSAAASGGSSPASVSVAGKSPEHLAGVAGCQSPKSQTTAAAVTQAAANLLKAVEETYSGYNSGDEHLQPKEGAITADEWQKRDEQFAKSMADRGYILKPVEEDGACLFRSISLQIYGDEEMHDVIRQHTMDYICKNREYFSHFVTEDINSYIKRKRRKDSHGNHIEIQAMSEIYSRPVEVYCYKPTPINIFNSEQLNNGYAPLRLSYQRGSHYNAIIDPYNATVGVGLGLAGYKPELQTKEAARLSEQLEIEQTMFEDKLKTTDWEATNEAIEEQIARESYLQWCRENLQKSRATATSATVTSAEAASDAEASPSKYSIQRNSGDSSSTITAAALATTSGSGASNINSSITAANLLHASSSCSSSSAAAMLDQSFSLSTKSLNAYAHNLKKDIAGSGSNSGGDLGFDSDDTDMSSTSSIGNSITGNVSPSVASIRAKKAKNRSTGLRATKKRRREQQQQQQLQQQQQQQQQQQHNTTISNAMKISKSDVPKDVNILVNLRKSPKRDTTALSAINITHSTRALTPEGEPLPSTSKKSSSYSLSTSPSSSSNATTPEKNSISNVVSVTTTASNSDNNVMTAAPSSSKQVKKENLSSFYQELLEASYAADGKSCGQLTESEMLQRAIQMSTQDYIEDQKRKYLHMGHK